MKTIRTKLKFYHTDAAGILFFSHIFEIAHDAYEAMLDEIGFPIGKILGEMDFVLPLVHAEADYKLPLRPSDEIVIQASIKRLGSTSYTVAYQILNRENKTAATAETVHVVVDKFSGKKREIPPQLKDGLSRFSAQIHFKE